MEELVFLKHDEAVCDSLQVAKKFHKRHAHIIRMIEQIKADSGADSAQNWAQSFRETTYKDASGKSNKMYLMNRDGFSLLVMGFTGKEALDWKWKYIDAFNKMESIIREKSTQEWISTRQQGKLTRRAETDTIQRLVEYAKGQGSAHADMLYMTYSKLANKMAGIQTRDTASVTELNNLSFMENIILNVIDEGIAAGKPYKVIYQDCKNRLETVKILAYLDNKTQREAIGT